MANFNLHTARALALLSLFLFALTYQSIHQYNNPAEPVVDCQSVEKHFHHHSQFHSCQICEYQITSWDVNVPLYQPWPKTLTEKINDYQAITSLPSFRNITLRGPPAV